MNQLAIEIAEKNLQYLKKNNWIVTCPICERDLYEYVGSRKAKEVWNKQIDANVFKPVRGGIPQPFNGEEMLCPFCGAFIVSEILGGE